MWTMGRCGTARLRALFADMCLMDGHSFSEFDPQIVGGFSAFTLGESMSADPRLERGLAGVSTGI